MLPKMVKLPGQSQSMVQLLPPPSDLNNPLTAVELARSAEVSQAPFSVVSWHWRFCIPVHPANMAAF